MDQIRFFECLVIPQCAISDRSAIPELHSIDSPALDSLPTDPFLNPVDAKEALDEHQMFDSSGRCMSLDDLAELCRPWW
jgi:hypothetical protein